MKGSTQARVDGDRVRCGRCGYTLATFEPGLLRLSPDWRAGQIEGVLEVADRETTRIRKNLRLLRDGTLAAADAPARIALRPYSTRILARAAKAGDRPSSAAIAWDRLPLTLRCPACDALNTVEKSVLQ